MQWWTNFLDWINSTDGWRIVSTAVIPFIAIIVAGIVAALIGRASARKVIELSEREVRASAVTALISAARKAAVWNTLPSPEQQHIDHLIGDAEIRLRLLPIAGTSLAADWARHEIAGMKRNAVSFSFQAEQSLLVFRDRLIEWQGRPGRAKKLFKNDLDSWAYDSSVSEQELVHEQQKWAAQQVTEADQTGTVTASPLVRPAAAPPLGVDLVDSSAVASASTPAASTPAASVPAPVVVPTPAVSSFGPAQSLGAVPASAVPIGTAEQPLHPLVEPEDPSRDVSEALIFSGGALGVASHDLPDVLSDDASLEEAPRNEHAGDEHAGDEHHDGGGEHDDEQHENQHENQHDEQHENQHEDWRG